MYAVLSTGWVLPSLIAPFAAGWIADTFGWRWVFIGLLPLALIAVILVLPALAVVDADTALAPPTASSRVPLAVLLAVGIGTLTASSYSARWWLVAPLAVAGVVLVVGALRRLMPPGVARATVGRPAAIACRMCAMAAFSGADFFIPLAARRFHHASSTTQGATILGAAVTWSIAQWFAAQKGGKIGSHRLVPIGFGFLGVGAAASMVVLIGSTPLWMTFVGWSVGGFGMGLLFNPTSHVAMGSADADNAGLAATQLNVADVFGFSAMAAFGGAMVSFADQTSLHLAAALTVVFSTAVAVSALGAVAGHNVRPEHSAGVADPAAAAAAPTSSALGE
jgi:MFS family permease